MAYNPQNPNGQATMANSAPVVIASDQSTVPVSITQSDTFGQIISAIRYNQVEVDFSATAPGSITDITVTNTNGGSSSNSNGQAEFTSGTNTSGGVKAVSNITVDYRPNAETYASFTAIFTTGIANSYQRIGIYDTNNGFFLGYEGTSFGVTIRKNTTDTTIARASWNVDTLTGGATSKYTLNGTPITYDPTKDNLFRIRFGWLGAASVTFEIYSPDGVWVPFHIYKIANVATSPTINDPNLPITLDIQKSTAGAGVLIMNTACWGAGTTSGYNKITATLTDNTLAQLGRSVITGQTTGGGGGYVNVKVNPSGALVTATTLDAGTASIGVLGANSGVDIGDVTINNAAGASAVNIQDGGNSITIDGSISNTSFEATQATATNLKTQAECYQGGTAVSSSNPLFVSPAAATSGGTSSVTGALTNTAAAVSGSAGQVYGWFIYNPNNTVAYVQFYNVVAASVIVGTTTPIYSIGIPALSAANVFGPGIVHSTAISVAATTTRAGGVAPSTSLDYNIFYK
jgi:hypothetical protein